MVIEQTVVIEQSDGIEPNQVFNASEVYLRSKISPDTRRLKVSKRSKDKDLTFRLDKGQRITDSFQGITNSRRMVIASTVKVSNKQRYHTETLAHH